MQSLLCGKAIGIIYSECVSVALVIQYAKRMSRIISSSIVYSKCLSVALVKQHAKRMRRIIS